MLPLFILAITPLWLILTVAAIGLALFKISAWQNDRELARRFGYPRFWNRDRRIGALACVAIFIACVIAVSYLPHH